jgi:hypothetical protein
MQSTRMVLFLFLLAARVLAVNTERWEVKTPADFMAGKLEQMTVTSDAGIQPGYPLTRLGDFAREIWCSTVTSNGVIWFGTGSPADVYAIIGDNPPTNIFQTGAIAVTALASDRQGNLFAATLAEGKIFRIQPGNRPASTEFCRVPSPYVWALVADRDGALFAATGPQGRIYRITPDGKVEEWYAAEDANIVSLALDTDGSLLAGSGERGLLYKVTGRNQAVVLHEFAEDEVKALVLDGDSLFIGVNKQRVARPRNLGTHQAKAAEFEKLTERLAARYGVQAAMEPESDGANTPATERAGNALAGSLYRRAAGGRMDRWANWENESILHLAVDGGGRVLTAMAGRGRVYRVPAGQRWERLFDLDEKQALTLAIRAGHLAFIGAGHIGAAYLVGSQTAPTGHYTSQVYDTKFLTAWGNLHWQGAGPIAITTRSGNTALPDATWSAWSDPLTPASAKVTSPQARFIQVRMQLARGENTQLRSFTLYSQTQNQRPEITAVEVGRKSARAADKPRKRPPAKETREMEAEVEAALAEAAEALPSKEEGARPQAPTSIRQISWVASDKDGDPLVYRLFYRAQGDALWLPISRDRQPLRKTEFRWDTESIPDGWYTVKVVASDEEANPPGNALTSERVSASFRVNNRRPDILDLSFAPESKTLSGRARNELGLIQALEYSLDGDDWKPFAPRDGVLDDHSEPFDLKLPLAPGPHTVAIRATDEDGNPGVGKISVQAP